MPNIDIDTLMRRAFNLPAPPRPVLPREQDSIVPLSDEDLDTLAAAGQPGAQIAAAAHPREDQAKNRNSR